MTVRKKRRLFNKVLANKHRKRNSTSDDFTCGFTVEEMIWQICTGVEWMKIERDHYSAERFPLTSDRIDVFEYDRIDVFEYAYRIGNASKEGDSQVGSLLGLRAMACWNI